MHAHNNTHSGAFLLHISHWYACSHIQQLWNAHVVFYVPQGWVFSRQGGAGGPGSGSVEPCHQQLAGTCSANRQHSGEDETETDKQKYGRWTIRSPSPCITVILPICALWWFLILYSALRWLQTKHKKELTWRKMLQFAWLKFSYGTFMTKSLQKFIFANFVALVCVLTFSQCFPISVQSDQMQTFHFSKVNVVTKQKPHVTVTLNLTSHLGRIRILNLRVLSKSFVTSRGEVQLSRRRFQDFYECLAKQQDRLLLRSAPQSSRCV